MGVFSPLRVFPQKNLREEAERHFVPESEERHVVPLRTDCTWKNSLGRLTFPPYCAKGEERMCERQKEGPGKPKGIDAPLSQKRSKRLFAERRTLLVLDSGC